MALPTAATPGYGFYPTLGPTPDVACDCLREWLPVYKRMLRFKGLGEIAVWQCTGDADASNGVHSLGGAFDIGGISNARAMIAREMGAYATWPRNWSGNQHTHGVLSGCPHNDRCAYQLVAMRIYRRDGLGYKGLAGPDPLPTPSRYRTWREGIAWAEQQMNQEDDMPYRDWPAADRAALTADVARAVRDTSVQVGNDIETIGVAVGRDRAAGRRIETQIAHLQTLLASLAAEVANAVHDKPVQVGNDKEPLGLAVGRTRAGVRALGGGE